MTSTTPSELAGTPMGATATTELARDIARYWWLWLVAGIAWLAAALVILQFDSASVTTIGVLVGIMFMFAGSQQLVLAFAADSLRWLWAIFGVLLLVSGIICFINPKATFAGLADILGFLFLVVGSWWVIQAFLERDDNPIWWLGLAAGILMVILAFWTSGQFFLHKAYTLLVFAGIWALMQGINDIVRAFRLRSLRDVI
jgi:hypothetical protein